MGRPTEKQIAVLKKNNKEVPETSAEASKIIGQLFGEKTENSYQRSYSQKTQPVFEFEYKGSNGNDVELLSRFDRYQKLAFDIAKKQHPDLDTGSNVFGQIMNAIITHLINLER